MKKESIIEIPDIKIMGNYKKIDFNEFDTFYVGTDNIKKSNQFLNSLWKNIDSSLSPDEFDRCPWFYIPHRTKIKQKNITYFGSIRSQVGYLHIAVSYKKKGSINNIHFLPLENKLDEKEIKSILKGIIKKAKKEIDKKYYYNVNCKLVGKFIGKKDNIDILDYISNNYIIKDSYIKFTISAQDKIDAKRKTKLKLRSIINFLSVETNVNFVYKALEIKETDERYKPESKDIQNIFQEYIKYSHGENKFIDLYPSLDDKVLLSKKGMEFIEYILKSDLKMKSDLNIFLNSCYHFREGIKKELLLKNKNILVGKKVFLQSAEKKQHEKQTIIDSTITHYLSSIETASLIGFNPEKCDHCGQTKYKITKRVSDFINSYLWETHGNIFKKIYDMRSKYLHSGISYAKNKDTETRPLLDKNTGTGCTDYNFMSLSIKGNVIGFVKDNIREWTSYALRNFYKSTSF
jgi:hypothetical protein